MRQRVTARFPGFSSMGMFLSHQDLMTIAKRPPISMVLQTPMSRDFRRMIGVEVNDVFYWADRSTGTLYYPDSGYCLTSTSMRLLFDLAGQTYEAMKQRFPDLRKHHIEPKPKTGPKPKTPPAWGDQPET